MRGMVVLAVRVLWRKTEVTVKTASLFHIELDSPVARMLNIVLSLRKPA